MANVLVTGGAGYVGSVCCAELLRKGHSVTIVDDLSTGHREAVPSGAAFFQIDIGNQSAMQSLVSHIRFDAVFHFAAKALIPESVSNPGMFFQHNVASGITMLEVLRSAGIKNFVFSSSAAVYGTPEQVPISEDDPKQPVNSYGETKLMFERVLDWYSRAYKWSVTALRYFNASGATAELGERHDPETHIIPLLLQAAAGERKVFNIYGDEYDTPDGTCLRDYVHVLDIASAHICALQNLNKPGMRAYNDLSAGAQLGVLPQQPDGAVDDDAPRLRNVLARDERKQRRLADAVVEMDIIAVKNNVLHFIEVKTRRTSTFGFPEERVSKSKIRSMLRTGAAYQYENPYWKQVQYNILSITLYNDQAPEYFFIEDVYV